MQKFSCFAEISTKVTGGYMSLYVVVRLSVVCL